MLKGEICFNKNREGKEIGIARAFYSDLLNKVFFVVKI